MKITNTDFLNILGLSVGNKIRVFKETEVTPLIEFYEVVELEDTYLLKSLTSTARTSLLYLYNKEFTKLSEHILTSNEKAFVEEYLKDGFNWVVRSCDGELYMNSEQPEKQGDLWYTNNGSFERIPKHLFQFVKFEDEDPVNLKELINGNQIN